MVRDFFDLEPTPLRGQQQPSFSLAGGKIIDPSAILPEEMGLHDIDAERRSLGKLALNGLWSGTLFLGEAALGTFKEALYKSPGFQAAKWTGRKPEELYDPVFSRLKDPVTAAREDIPTDTKGAIEWAAFNIPKAVPYIAAIIGTKGLALKAGLPGWMGIAASSMVYEGEVAYRSAKKKGASEERANTERAVVGGINAALQAYTFSGILSLGQGGNLSAKALVQAIKQRAFADVAKSGKKLTANVLGAVMAGAIQEAGQTATLEGADFIRGDIVRDDAGNPDWWATLNESAVRVAQAGAIGGAAGGVFALGRGLMGGGEATAEITAKEIKAVHKAVVESPNMGPIARARAVMELQDMSRRIAIKPGEALPDMTLPPELRGTLEAAEKLGKGLVEWEVSRPKEALQIKSRLAEKFQAADEIATQSRVADPEVNARAQVAAMSGEMKLEMDPLRSQFDQIDVSRLYDAVRTSGLPATKRLDIYDLFEDVFDKGRIPQPKTLQAFDDLFGTHIYQAHKALNLPKPTGIKAWLGKHIAQPTVELANLERAWRCSFDQSFALRQGGWLMTAKPKTWLKSVARGYRALANEGYARFDRLRIETDPYYADFKSLGGRLREIGSTTAAEDAFMTDYAKRLPGVKQSARGNVSSLNNMTYWTWRDYVSQWKGTPLDTPANKTKLLRFLEAATGRGSLGSFEKYARELGALGWAPRFVTSQWQRHWRGAITGGPEVRKIYAGMAAKWFGSRAALLTLLSMNKSAHVEIDPRSSDWGKLRIGNARIDMWGGQQQFARLLAQTVWGQGKDVDTGHTYDMERRDAIMRFLRFKASPATTAMIDLYTGQTSLGKRVEATPEFVLPYLAEKAIPLAMKDILSAMDQQGIGFAAAVAPMTLHGVSSSSYERTAAAEARILKEGLAKQFYNDKWDNLSPIAQNMLRVSNPDIAIAENKARIESLDFVRSNMLIEQRKVTSKRLRKALPRDVRFELDRLAVTVPGLSRRVSGDWFLNDRRAKEYEQNVKNGLMVRLAEIIHTPNWDQLSDAVQRRLLETIIQTVTSQARREIVWGANIQDLTRMGAFGGRQG